MIVGIGTDILHVGRIEKLIEKHGDRFVSRILSKTEEEIFLKSTNKIAYLARRFAGKEALFKALGKGIGNPFRFNDITITNDDHGKPEVQIFCRENIYKQEIPSQKIHISLSDDLPVVVAFVVISS